MGKSYKERPDKWRRQLQKKQKKQKWQKGNFNPLRPQRDLDSDGFDGRVVNSYDLWESKPHTPFEDPPEYHQSFA